MEERKRYLTRYRKRRMDWWSHESLAVIMSKSQWLAFHLIWFACVTYLTENYVLPCQVPGMVLIVSMHQTNSKIRTSLKY